LASFGIRYATATATRRRSGTWVVRLTLLLIGLLLPLLLVESGLRLAGPSLSRYTYVGLDTRRNLSYFMLHPIFGGFHLPNSTIWQWTAEYVTRVDINSLGLREREIGYDKPSGVRRILVLGDSFVEGAEVQAEETMARRLEALLEADRRANGGPEVQVINAGVLGYSSAQEYLLLKHEGLRYHPDLVIQVVFTGNDVTENTYALDYPPLRQIRPYFQVDASGALHPLPLRLPPSPWGPPDSLRQRLRRESLLFSKLDPDELGRVPAEPGYIRTLVAAYADHSSADWEDAWQVTDALLTATRDEAEATGARFLLVNAPAPWEVDASYWDMMRWYLGLPSEGWNFEEPHRRLAEIVARRRMTFLDLRPAMRQSLADGQHPYYHFDAHWTRTGHDVAARAILQSGLVSSR
jgi:SGNH hydrolase-like domain, acetyltransferase AlgX